MLGNSRVSVSLGAALLITGFLCGAVQARDRVLIVGSSTVFPFSVAVAEAYGQKSGDKTPVVESTGSGGGIKLFCQGTGPGSPDISNASRRMKRSELDTCRANGVTPVEVSVGYDGIVLANSRSGPQFKLTKEQIFLALAKDVVVNGKTVPNPYMHWSDIAADLPAEKIEVFGPPPTSGTRDAFEELVMEAGCKAAGLSGGKACRTIRQDGAYLEAGENDDLIVQKLEANPVTVGIFGFSFLDQNSDQIQGAEIGGVEPSFDTIASGAYPGSRALYVYLKKEHVDLIPGMNGYMEEFTSEAAWGDGGYLKGKGLIPLTANQRKDNVIRLQQLIPLRF